ncbi:Nn.00g054520.m01.CDS01 [Neocucurbitaria sp. VM-36]
MQFSIATLATVFAATVSALPADVAPRQTTFTELAIWNNSGCQSGGRIGTVNINDSNVCQNFPTGIMSGTVDIDMPAGCQIQFFVGQGCNSAQSLVVPRDQVPHRCFEFGPGKDIGSALVSGTCSSS